MDTTRLPKKKSERQQQFVKPPLYRLRSRTSLFGSGIRVFNDPGSSADYPLTIKAVPGMVTFLDVALYHAVSSQLVNTVVAAHALLQTFVQMRLEAIQILRFFNVRYTCGNNSAKYPYSNTTSGGGANPSSAADESNSATFAGWFNGAKGLNSNQRHQNRMAHIRNRMEQLESFARECLDCTHDMFDKISTDRLATTANLSDPYHPHCATYGFGPGSAGATSVADDPSSSAGLATASVQNLFRDTGRRHLPRSQRARDCWESPRLHCPDYIWADEVFQQGIRVLNKLNRHALVVSTIQKSAADPTGANSTLAGITSASGSGSGGTVNEFLSSSLDDEGTGGSDSATGFLHLFSAMWDDALSVLAPLTTPAERHATILLQLVFKDVPIKLVQFRAAMEAESVVSKRLFLVKTEYRAPFRAFLEGHQSIQRAPRLELVDEYLKLQQSSKHKLEDRRDQVRQEFQEMLEDPTLLQALALEKQASELEEAISRTIYPFAELARYIDQPRRGMRLKITIVPFGELVSTEEERLALEETLRRLRGLLLNRTTLSGPEVSMGIRPLLLDLQGVPRDDEIGAEVFYSARASGDDDEAADDAQAVPAVEARVARFVQELKTLRALCQVKNSFKMETHPLNAIGGSGGGGKNRNLPPGNDVDIPSHLVRGCTSFDEELFTCQFLDWYDVVRLQNELIAEGSVDFEELADRIRTSEMEVGIANASEQSLEMVKQRLQLLFADRDKRFDVLVETLEELCLREMNLHVAVTSPEEYETLALKSSTSPMAKGVFADALLAAGERLHLG
jgi:hypothetical protein